MNDHRFWPQGTTICGAEPDQPPTKVTLIEPLAGGGSQQMCMDCWLEWLRELIERNGGIAPPAERLDEFIVQRGDRIMLKPERARRRRPGGVATRESDS